MPGTTGRIAMGLVGLGKIARDQHLPAIAGNSDFELVATADPIQRAEGLAGYDSLTAMLTAHPEIVAVSLCTPPTTRSALAAEALAAGCHVMLEKPPAATVEAAANLGRQAKQAARSLFTTWHSRETRCVETASTWLQGKTIESASIDWREDIRQWHPGQDWILDADGFGVFDPGINALSILTALVPGAIQLDSAALAIPANRRAPISARLGLDLPGNARLQATFDFLRSHDQVWDLSIETDQGQLLLRKGGHELWINGTLEDSCADEEYPRLYRRFAGLVQSGTSDVDVSPLAIVAAAFRNGERTAAEPFEF